MYGANLNISCSPLKNKTPKHFIIANFGHPVSKSWLGPKSLSEYLPQRLLILDTRNLIARIRFNKLFMGGCQFGLCQIATFITASCKLAKTVHL